MLRGIFAFVWFVVVTLGLGVPAMVIQFLRPGGDMTMRAGRVWSRAMLWAVGARVEYRGLEHLRARLPCLFISNHESNVDIWALARVLPIRTRFVAKQSLFRIPVIGWAMTAGGFVSIDRANRTRAIVSLRVAADKIRSGRPVVLFPEGTRSRTGSLLPFKKGAFHLALQAEVPLVPIAIAGSGRVMPAGALRVRPGPVLVQILPPLEITEFLPDDQEGLLNRVHDLICDALERQAGTGEPQRESEGAA